MRVRANCERNADRAVDSTCGCTANMLKSELTAAENGKGDESAAHERQWGRFGRRRLSCGWNVDGSKSLIGTSRICCLLSLI